MYLPFKEKFVKNKQTRKPHVDEEKIKKDM